MLYLGQHLRILVIEAPPFVIVRNISNHGQSLNNQVNFHSDPLKTKNPNIVIYGFIADFIRELQKQMHFNYTIDVANLTTNYHSLVASVAGDNRQYDMTLSDIRITSSRLLMVDFSTPFHENTFRIITRKNPYTSSLTLFSCFNPFTWDVWVTIFAVIIYSSFIIYLFERQNIEIENGESGIKSIFMGTCQILGSVIIMTGNIPLTTNASRLTVLGLYGLFIILGATYTANLSSFLTLNRVQPAISGIDDIKNGRLPFSRIGIVTNSAASDYYMQNISSMYHPLFTAEEIYSRLLDYTIDASIWDSYILEYAVSNYYCANLSVVGVGFLKSSYGIVLPKDWPYKKDLDVHIMAMRESERLESLENRWLGHGTCSSSSSSSGKIDQANGSNNEKFPLDVMGGLFLTFLILTGIAFILHLWRCRVAINNIFWKIIERIKLLVYIIRPITRHNINFAV
jgi:ionotropic glutamate receptor